MSVLSALSVQSYHSTGKSLVMPSRCWLFLSLVVPWRTTPLTADLAEDPTDPHACKSAYVGPSLVMLCFDHVDTTICAGDILLSFPQVQDLVFL